MSQNDEPYYVTDARRMREFESRVLLLEADPPATMNDLERLAATVDPPYVILASGGRLSDASLAHLEELARGPGKPDWPATLAALRAENPGLQIELKTISPRSETPTRFDPLATIVLVSGGKLSPEAAQRVREYIASNPRLTTRPETAVELADAAIHRAFDDMARLTAWLQEHYTPAFGVMQREITIDGAVDGVMELLSHCDPTWQSAITLRAVQARQPRCAACGGVFLRRDSVEPTVGVDGVVVGLSHRECPEGRAVASGWLCHHHQNRLPMWMPCGRCYDELDVELRGHRAGSLEAKPRPGALNCTVELDGVAFADFAGWNEVSGRSAARRDAPEPAQAADLGRQILAARRGSRS